ncbi:TPA: cation diffusion facilitator family transporter [Candidatus Saccharibacteria bacterium]|nr:cation diffusion facilitator family transporter [Candidatus Saccharibacteria bacterium]HIO87304.1 cation diffusion facilitator family transporter [Candidatus Saccharibacteria bacterium]
MAKKQTISQKRAVGTSFAVSVGDVLFNLFVGFITGSAVMFSQALQGLSDLVTAGILFFGVTQSEKAADKQHPLGYGREVFFYVLVAGLFMFVGTGLFSLFLGLQQVIDQQPIDTIWLALVTLSFGLFTNGYSFNLSRKRLGINFLKRRDRTKLVSSSLVETKATLLVDSLGTASALFGLVAIGLYLITGSVIFDGIGAMIVGVSMMVTSALLVYDAKSLIVGRAITPAMQKAIVAACTKLDGVNEVLDLKTLHLGSGKLLIILEIHFVDDLTTNEIEVLSDKIKTAVKKKIPQANTVQVEAETP